MTKFVPKEKTSKQNQKKINARSRGDWNGLNPCTRTIANKKAYSRKRTRDIDFDV